MMAVPRSWFLPGSLFAIAGLLLAGSTALFMRPPAVADISRALEKPSGMQIIEATLSPRVMAARESFDDIVTRSLFSVERKGSLTREKAAPAEEPSEEVRSLAELKTLILVGIALRDGKRTAILRKDGRDETLWISEGMNLEGWKVAAISAKEIILKDGESQEVVTFPPVQSVSPNNVSATVQPTTSQ